VSTLQQCFPIFLNHGGSKLGFTFQGFLSSEFHNFIVCKEQLNLNFTLTTPVCCRLPKGLPNTKMPQTTSSKCTGKQ